MLAVAISENGVLIDKQVYGGDTSQVVADINLRKTAEPNLQFDLYDDSNMTVFDALQMAAPAVPDLAVAPAEQTDWLAAKAKGTDAALLYIAQHLGLEK
jgi:hypothetical protein